MHGPCSASRGADEGAGGPPRKRKARQLPVALTFQHPSCSRTSTRSSCALSLVLSSYSRSWTIPRRASRGQLGCSLKWRPWVKFEQQHQEQQSHQPSCFLVSLAALDNGQPATLTSFLKQLKQRTRSLCKLLAFPSSFDTSFSTNPCRVLTNQFLGFKNPRVHSLG